MRFQVQRLYVNATNREEHILYPNNQRTNYTYWPNAAATAGNGDQRLRKIENLLPGGANASTFEYGYDAEGVIQTWRKQVDAATALDSSFLYDLADQLTEATVPAPAATTGYLYRYDVAGNRTSEQIDNAVSAASLNNLNQVKSLSATGPIRFAGSLNEAGTVTVNGQVAAVAADHSFQTDVTLPPGNNTVTVVAKDTSNNTKTKNYTVAQG